MKTRYSKSTGTFYPYDIDYPVLPVDLQIVEQSDFVAVMTRPDGAAYDFDAAGALTITPAPAPTAAELQAAADAAATAAAKIELAKIDAQSIRSMREFLLAKFPGDALLPQVLAGHDSAAATERAKIK